MLNNPYEVSLKTLNYIEKLYDLFEAEEKAQLPGLCKDVVDKAEAIYRHTNDENPFYIVLMVVQVHERAQNFLCQFALVKNAKNTGQKLKNCLVWFCDKKRGIFKLATELCDLSPPKHWGERTLPNASSMTLEQK